MPRNCKTGTKETQSILFQPDSDWRLPSMAALPTRWQRYSKIGLDIETCCPDLHTLGPAVRRNGFIAGVSFAVDDEAKRSWYLPVAHALGPNLDREAVMQYLRDQAAEFTGEIVGANLQYDIDYLAQYGVVFKRATFRDVQVAAALINELEDGYSLNTIAERNGFGGKTEDLLGEAAGAFRLDKKKDMWRLPAKFVGPYAEDDAALPLKIFEKQQKQIDIQNLQNVFDLESKLLPVCVKMRRRGVKVDFDKLAEIELRMLEIEQVQCAYIKELTGVNFGIEDINKAAVTGPLLEEHCGCVLPRTPKSGAFKVGKEVLAAIDTPLSHAIAKQKRANKIRTTFVASIRKHSVEGRIHCTFTQLRKQREDGDTVGAAFGRLSSSTPNLQQQPVRDPYSHDWRCIYLPDDGGTWGCLDYSEQEPRTLLHWAGFTAECCLPKSHTIRKAVEKSLRKYWEDPRVDGHQMMADLIGWTGKEGRTRAKAVLLGLCYGMGGVKLAGALGMKTILIRGRDKKLREAPGPDTIEILDTFNARLPYVNWMAKVAEKKVKEQGYLTTLSGRRCRFPQDDCGNYEWTHKSLNRLIQGSAADQTKTAMVEADRQGFKLQLQIHDELDLTIHSPQEAELLAELMREVIPMRCPSKVDVEVGASWGQIA
jgi:DNA polymerase I-like protein with 3'-5' exonuclease and polymerase domains